MFQNCQETSIDRAERARDSLMGEGEQGTVYVSKDYPGCWLKNRVEDRREPAKRGSDWSR